MDRKKMPWLRAVLISLPFFVLSLFWQAYDYIVPLILTEHFHLGTTLYSLVMSADNIIALLFLPLFGILSDRIRSRLGRRTPLILIGTLGGAAGWTVMTVIDARAAAGGTGLLAPFLFSLLTAVFFMSLYRSPSAALVADCFIRPQRTKANAVLNLIGALGGVLFGLAGRRLIRHGDAVTLYTGCMFLVSAGMAVGTLVYLLSVRENRLVEATRAQNRRLGLVDDKTDPADTAPTKLNASERRSLALILGAVFFVYMSYNGFNTHYTNFLVQHLKRPASWTGPYLLEVVGAVLMMLPAAFVTSRLGRRKSCVLGAALCTAGYIGTSFVRPDNVNTLYLWFAVSAVSFPLFGINLGPMVLEIGKDSDAGRYMGYYYIATTAAQIVTPTLASLFINRFGFGVIGIYGGAFTLIAVFALLPVRHGDVRPSLAEAVDDAVQRED